MLRITYAGGGFVTGTDIAEAVLEYASSLARAGDVDIVDVQVRETDGTLGRVRMLLGASMPIALEADGDTAAKYGELRDEVSVAQLTRLTSERRSSARQLTAEEAKAWQAIGDIDL